MKKLLLLFACLIVMAGCNVNRTTIQLTQHKGVKYKLQAVPDEKNADYFVYTSIGYNNENSVKMEQYFAELEKLNQMETGVMSQSDKDFCENSRNILKTQIENLPKDSTRNFIVSFQDYIPNVNYTIVRSYWWDYSNFRFLVPFLPFFDRWHNYNQCVNKAVKKCLQYNCDGVIIAGDYSTFKLFKVKQVLHPNPATVQK